MKGIVFTNFLEMVEQKFGYDLVDKLIEASNLPSQGIYTAVGTYAHQEIVTLVVNLSALTQISVEDLLKTFGRYMFPVLANTYSHFLKDVHSAFDLICSIENYIHVEVHKLYPDAELPHFDVHKPSAESLVLDYHSDRSMGAFALGLLEECLAFYHENASVSMHYLNESGSKVRFEIIKQ